ncbi:universal stress protein [Haloferax prahovense]|uniref:universal stress protein n=1 Tax=Haloferax prahovense TaxID=381852 RepID=UPI000677E357|nr:universal stress protein [Haloferax prahovense]
MAQSLFSRVVVPVANKDDAAATAEALIPYVDGSPSTVIAVHVIEKAGGAPDKASVEQRELAADEMFQILRDRLQGVDIALQTEYLYGTDVGDAIITAAHDFDASTIVFTPRGGSRWLKLLTGDVTTTLVNESDLPVLVLPDPSEQPS